MPRFAVQITDTSDSAGSAVHWTVEADSPDAVIELGYRRWDEKYSRRPLAPQVSVERLDR